jgi:hypothetical protein
VATIAVALAVLATAVTCVLVVRDRHVVEQAAADTRPSAAAATDVPSPPTRAASQTPDDAQAAAQFWFDALNTAIRTGHTDGFQAASDPSCEPCNAIRTSVSTVYNSGGTMRGGDYLVRGVSLENFFNLQRPTFNVVFDRSPRTALDAGGHDLSSAPGATFVHCQLVLTFTDDRWRVLTVLPPNLLS